MNFLLSYSPTNTFILVNTTVRSSNLQFCLLHVVARRQAGSGTTAFTHRRPEVIPILLVASLRTNIIAICFAFGREDTMKKSWIQGVDFLKSMGYSGRDARNALQVTQGDLHRAAELLLESAQLKRCSSYHQEEEEKDSAALSLANLKDSILIHVLKFLSNVPDFCRCAQTCRRFHQLLQDDDIWKYCKGRWKSDVGSNRQRAIQHYEIKVLPPVKQIEIHQSGVHFQDKHNKINLEWNYRLRVLQVQGWRNLITKVMNLPTIEFPYPNSGEMMNDSTVIALAHVVESNMVEFLEAVCQLSIHRVKDHNIEPSVRDDDLELGRQLIWYTNSWTRVTFLRVLHEGDKTDNSRQEAVRQKIHKMLRSDTKTTIVHHLLRLSGIAACEEDSVLTIWKYLVVLMGGILHEATLLHQDRPKSVSYERYLRSLPPSAVENGANRLRLRHTSVYGLPEMDEEEELPEEEEEEYDENDSDFNTLSSSGEESNDYFSIHSDKDCPDEHSGSSFEEDGSFIAEIPIDATDYVYKTDQYFYKTKALDPESPTTSTESGTL